VFWVISVYFNLRNILPNSGTFAPGQYIYIYVRRVKTAKPSCRLQMMDCGCLHNSNPWAIFSNIRCILDLCVVLSSTIVMEVLLFNFNLNNKTENVKTEVVRKIFNEIV